MNREIKFRGRDYEHGEWIYGYVELLHSAFGPETHTAFIHSFMDWNLNSSKQIVSGTIGQFCGLTDKKGKEIYEADVIRQNTYQGQKSELVEFGHGGFFAGWHTGSSRGVLQTT